MVYKKKELEKQEKLELIKNTLDGLVNYMSAHYLTDVTINVKEIKDEEVGHVKKSKDYEPTVITQDEQNLIHKGKHYQVARLINEDQEKPYLLIVNRVSYATTLRDYANAHFILDLEAAINLFNTQDVNIKEIKTNFDKYVVEHKKANSS